MNQIEQIASVHLGKAGDGTVVAPYVTPDEIESSLLVAVPRNLNRIDYEIYDDNLPFTGVDVWNCYEVSALTDNGYPVSGVLRISYPAESNAIVESKSLKLYLNSFNLVRLGSTINKVSHLIENIVTHDLMELLECKVNVRLFTHVNRPFQSSDEFSMATYCSVIEDFVDVSTLTFDHYTETPSLLKVVDSEDSLTAEMWTTDALRSNCRVTNQPDWGDLIVMTRGGKTIDPGSLLQYVVSMRKENHFHEEIVECVYKRLYDLLPGIELAVGALYTRRGGIDINPVRASNVAMLDMFDSMTDMQLMQIKTARQ